MAERGVSLIDQPVRIRGLAERLGLDVLDVVEDGGECSKTLERPGLQRILAALRVGEARGVVVAGVDRLTRHVGDLAYMVDDYFTDPAGSYLFSASETVETRTAAGRLQLYIMGAVSQYQREKTVENTVTAMDGKRRRSERQGNVPFGKAIDAGDGRRSKTGRPVALVTSVDDLAVAELIGRLRRKGGTLRSIADELNVRGIPSKRGITKRSTGRWSKSSVAEILKKMGQFDETRKKEEPGEGR